MIGSCGKGDDAQWVVHWSSQSEIVGHGTLSIAIITPRYHNTVCAEHTHVPVAGGDLE